MFVHFSSLSFIFLHFINYARVNEVDSDWTEHPLQVSQAINSSIMLPRRGRKEEENRHYGNDKKKTCLPLVMDRSAIYRGTLWCFEINTDPRLLYVSRRVGAFCLLLTSEVLTFERDHYFPCRLVRWEQGFHATHLRESLPSFLCDADKRSQVSAWKRRVKDWRTRGRNAVPPLTVWTRGSFCLL